MRKSKKRLVLQITAGILGVILVMLLGLTGYTEYLLGRMNYVDPDSKGPTLSQEQIDQILSGGDETEDPDFTGPTLDANEELATAGQQIHKDSNTVNILLIGADYQGTDHGRSDTTILVTFNKANGTLTMTSFMRDMYVKIPGYAQNKLNAAYSLGGMNLLQETLKLNFGVQADGVVEVDFDQFIEIIDLLGGVDLELNSKEAAFVNKKSGSSFTAGVQHLAGKEAIWYARFRGDAQGDFNRTSRQRTLLNTLLETYKSAKLTTIVGLLDDILPLITTNMSKEEIVDYAIDLFPLLMDTEVINQRIPCDDSYYLTKVNSISVIKVDLEKNIQFLQDTIGSGEE